MNSNQQVSKALQILLLREEPPGYLRAARIDLRYLFCVGMGRLPQRRLVRGGRSLDDFLESQVNLENPTSYNLISHYDDLIFSALEWSQLVYLRWATGGDLDLLQQLALHRTASERTVKSLALLQLVQVFQCSRHVLEHKSQVGLQNFFRLTLNGDLDDPIFQEFYFHHYFTRLASSILTDKGFDPESRFKEVFNLNWAADLLTEEKVLQTAEDLAPFVKALELLLVQPNVKSAAIEALESLRSQCASPFLLESFLRESVSPVSSWLLALKK